MSETQTHRVDIICAMMVSDADTMTIDHIRDFIGRDRSVSRVYYHLQSLMDVGYVVKDGHNQYRLAEGTPFNPSQDEEEGDDDA